MKKIKLFLAATAAMLGMSAQAITIDTDLTAQFQSLTRNTSWKNLNGGNSQYTATDFCPMVKPNGLPEVQVCEYYQNDGCANTGTMLHATVSGLTAGTYRIELYGASAFTFGRGFGSLAFTGDLSTGSSSAWNAGQHIDSETGVYMYASTSVDTYQLEIPIYYATNFPDGATTVVLEGVEVGNDGQIEIGMNKESQSTNWHVVQLKGVTATVDADEVLQSYVTRAYDVLYENDLPTSVADRLEQTINTYDRTWSTKEQYETAFAALEAAIDLAEAYVVAGPKLDAMAAFIQTTNFYTAAAYEEYYGQWVTKLDNGTLTMAEADALQDPFQTTGWRAATTVDNFLLSVWDVDPDFAGAYYINTWSTEGANDGTGFEVPFFEYWTGDGNSLEARTMTATIEDLEPNMTYTVELWGRVRERNNGTKVGGSILMSVNGGDQVDLTQGAQVGSSQFYLDNFTAIGVADGKGKIIVTITVAANSNISWLSFKNVMYAKVNDVRIPLAQQLAKLVEQANNALQTEAPTTGVYNELQRVVNAYDGLTYRDRTEAQFREAIQDVQNVLEGMSTIQAAMAETAKIMEKAEQALELGNSSAYNTLNNLVNTNNNKVDQQSSGAGVDAINEALLNAMYAHVEAIVPAAGQQIDLTFLLTNPDLSEFDNWARPEGWGTEQTFNPQNYNVMKTNQAVANTADPSLYAFFEYWSAGAEAQNGYTVYMNAYLPAGTYKMEALCVAGYGGGHRYGIGTDDGGKPGSVSSEDNKNITFSAGDIDGTLITTATLEPAELDFVQNEGGEVKIGLKAHPGNTSNWMGIGYVTLYKVAAEELVVDENSNFTPRNAAGKVTLKRTFSGNWESFVVPFHITNAELKAAFGNDVQVAELRDHAVMEEDYEWDEEQGDYVPYQYDTENSTIEAVPMDEPSISPNKPVLIKASTKATSFVFENRTMAAGDPVRPGVNFDFVGTYSINKSIAVGNYYIKGAAETAQFVRVTGGAYNLQKATRAYLMNKNGGTIQNDVVTAIENLDNATRTNGAIFNIAGQQVSRAQKGVYIVDGKKVVVK